MNNRYKIIAGAVIAAVLALAFFFGGSTPSTAPAKTTVTHTPAHTPKAVSQAADTPPAQTPEASASSAPKPTTTPSAKAAAKPTEKTASQPQAGDMKYSEQNGMEFDKDTGQDRYRTDPVPEGEPVPVEPQEVIIFEGTDHTCTLSVRCDTILDNMPLLDHEKHELIPPDGIIYPEQEVIFHEGESVFDVTLREMQNSKIHFEFTKTPVYNSAYIEGINNIYEFDCGELSGWEYSVNGWFPNYGCSRYQIHDGDKIEWHYTCDLGRDIGGYNSNE